jgi:hypothetical protein
MKKIAILSIALMPVCSFAQSVSPDVISTAGTSFNDGTSQLDWTLGEPVTSTFTSGTDELTQGFHQPEMIVTAIGETVNTAVSVFPNPTQNLLNVKITDPAKTIVELYTVEGKLLQSKIAVNTDVLIDMSNYTSGNYLLVVKEDKGKTNTYKISKTN